MRENIRDYLAGEISRRDFVRGLTAAGFSLAATRSALGALEPIVNPGLGTPASAPLYPFEGGGGELLAEQLVEFGTRFVFLCNSSGMGPLADAVVDRPQIQLIQAVSEHQTMAIADGYAKASGEVAFATFSRVGGPGASANMYNAMKDRTPIVIFTDHANTTSQGRDGHEDLEDWLTPFAQYTKWRWLVSEPSRIPEWLAKGFKVSSVAPGGPTMIRVPRNLLYRTNVESGIFPRQSINVPMNLVPNPQVIEQAAEMLVESSSPILYLSHEVWSSGARSDVVELSELLAIPATQARSWGADFPTDHPHFLGQYYDPMRFPSSIDLFLNLGAHMPSPPSEAKVIHAGMDTRHIGGSSPTDLSIVAEVKETARALIEAVKSVATPERLARIRNDRRPALVEAASGMRTALTAAAGSVWDQVPVSWPRLLLTLNQMIDEDAIVVTEVGTEDWVLRAFPFADGKKTRIGRTVGRALGWGVGASIGVQLAHPNRQVISLQGDGGFLFGQSDALWSMSRYDVPVITVIGNNHSYDEPRNQMQARGGRAAQENKDMICYLGSPDVDFTHIGQAYGIRGERVLNPDQLEPAIERAIRTAREGRPYILDVEVARTGLLADSTWHPAYSVAAVREGRG